MKVVHGILKTMKDNLGAVQGIVDKWDGPMIERKTKPMEKEEFERSFKSMKASHFSDIKEAGKQIHSLLKETNKVLRVSNASVDWRCYVEFVNSVIVEGLSKAVMTSLELLLDQINPEAIKLHYHLPLFEIMLVLNGTDGINFQPPLGHDAKKKGMPDMIDNIVGSFFQISTLFKRLDAEGTYMREMHSDLAVNSVLAMLSDSIATNDMKCHDLKRTFDKYGKNK